MGADDYVGTIFGDLMRGSLGDDTLTGGRGDDVLELTNTERDEFTWNQKASENAFARQREAAISDSILTHPALALLTAADLIP